MDRFSILKNPIAKPCHALKQEDKSPFTKEDCDQLNVNIDTMLGFSSPVEEEATGRRSAEDRSRDDLVRQYLSNAHGRATLATSMSVPLRTRLNGTSLVRRIFYVDNVGERMLPIYDVGDNQQAYFISESGEDVLRSDRNRIVVPIFQLTSNPQVPLHQLRNRQYDLINRAQNQAYTDLRRLEEIRALELLSAATENRVVHSNQSNLINTMRDTIASFSANDLSVANIILSHQNFPEFRRFSFFEDNNPAGPTGSTFTGILGTAFGTISVYATTEITDGSIYIMAEPSFTGILPIQNDVTVLSADDPYSRMVGFSATERIGMFCHTPGIHRIILE